MPRHAKTNNAASALFVATVESHLLNFHKPYMNLLKQKGYEVHVATRLGARLQEFEELGVITHNVEFSRSPYSPFVIKSLVQMLALLRENSFDLVHVHTPVAAFVTRLVCQLTNTHPVIYTAHGFHFYKGAPLRNWLLYYPMERLAAHWTDGLITINKEDYELAKNLRLRSGGQLFYVPGVGVDVDSIQDRVSSIDRVSYRRTLGIDADAYVLTTVAELSPVKNHEQVILAITSLTDVPIVYLIVGSGERERYLKSLVKKLGIDDKVVFLGFRSDIPEILAITDVFVLTSKREGLPRAIMEAMAAGKPIVATNVRGNRDLVKHGENGLLVGLGDVAETAQALQTLIDNPRLREEFGLRGKEMVDAYSLGEVLPQMKGIYEFFLHRAGSSRLPAD